ncbi:MAG: ParB/RepB/Spo0J family partition protein [Planctomycetota bacterium]
MEDRRLGKGFEDLAYNTANQSKAPKKLMMTVEIPIGRISPNPWQPRKTFSEESLKELAESIRISGIISPIIVRRDGDYYVLIAGERRLRAAQLAGLQRIPAIIREVTEQEMLELSLIENVQREDLNPLEKALACRELMNRYGLTQEQVADRLGQKRPTIANLLRLLNLPPSVQAALRDGVLSMGHARAILAADSPEKQELLLQRTIEEGLSVRDIEKLASKSVEPGPEEMEPENEPTAPRRSEPEVNPHIAEVEDYLRRFFGTRVVLKHKRNGKGSIVIEYYNVADLNRMLSLLEDK